MSGIVGLLQSDAVLAVMTEAIRHRGPDADGHWLDANSEVALGHRRLAILGSDARRCPPIR